MKLYIILYSTFLTLLTISCKNKTEVHKGDSLKVDVPTLHGYWVNVKYLESIRKETSLSKIQFQNASEVTTIDIDSVSSDIGFNFHEGMGCTLQKIDDKHFALYDTEASGKKQYDLEVIDANTIKVGTATLTKVGARKMGITALDYKLVGGHI